MSFFRALDRTSTVSNSPARPFLTFLYPALSNSNSNSNSSKPRRNNISPKKRCFSASPRPVTHRPHPPRASTRSTDSFFINALARAASCPEHAKPSSYNTLGGTRRKSISTKERYLPLTTQHRKKSSLTRVQKFAERELKALVDYYGPGFKELPEQPFEDMSPLIWNVGDDHQPWPYANPEDEDTVKRLEALLLDETASHAQVYDTYKLLPGPGVAYLTSKLIHDMLHHLSVLERPTPIAMQRFLSILDDMKTAAIHATRSEWTTAIHLAGRFMGTVSEDQVEHALQLWRDMEKRAGIRGGLVTMNVLFDIAVRAGKYRLAETFLREMQVRRMRYHRHFRVSLIFFHGVQQDSDAVRKAYYDLVSAKEVVDTVVLNAVIAALLRAGEPMAAEHVFERMKRLAAAKSSFFGIGAPNPLSFNTRIWRGRRALGLHLTHRSRQLIRENATEEEVKELQDAAPVSPNSRTYGLLIRHHAFTGNMTRIVGLVREMGYNAVPMDGTIFIVIIHGFVSHGGVRYSAWTRVKLEQTWREYLDAVRLGLDRTWISRLAVVAVLKAFHKSGADAERLAKVWDEARELWTPEPGEEERALKVLRRLVNKVKRN